MRLVALKARFDKEVPTEAVFRRELVAEVGNDSGLESFQVEGNLVGVNTLLDPVTRPYAIKVLQRLGGVLVDQRTLQPAAPELPGFVSSPWPEVPLWKRVAVHLGFQLGLATSAVGSRIL